MAPKGWTTPDQLTFLNSNLQLYHEHTTRGTQTHFWAIIHGQWFEKWSEIEALIEKKVLPPQAALSDVQAWPESDRALYQAALTERQNVSGSSIRGIVIY